MELPSHPEDDEPSAGRSPSTKTSRATVIFVVVISVVLLIVIVLHLTGVVGPTRH